MKKKMLKKDLVIFKKQLNDIKEKLLGEIRQVSEDALKHSSGEVPGGASGYSFHMADAATDTYDREFSVGLASNNRELLYEIADALKRIDEASFGVCESCKGVITKTRLKAIPYARHCLKCQREREK